MNDRVRELTRLRVARYRERLKKCYPDKWDKIKSDDNKRSRARFVKKYFGLTMKQYKQRVKKCAVCGTTDDLHLHHENGKEDNKKLVCLCAKHHRKVHWDYDSNGNER